MAIPLYSIDMPFKSRAQRRMFYTLAEKGKISKDTVKSWEEETKVKGSDLPEYSRKQKALLVRKAKVI